MHLFGMSCHGERTAASGVDLADSLAFQLLCDKHHLGCRAKIRCNQAASLAAAWAVRESDKANASGQSKGRGESSGPEQLRAETEELLMELVDMSGEIENMQARERQMERFLDLADCKSRWLGRSVDQESAATTITRRSSGKDEGSYGNHHNLLHLIRRIDLNACQEATDRMTTLLLGFLTIEEREEEERAVLLYNMSNADEEDLFDTKTMRAIPDSADDRRRHQELAR